MYLINLKKISAENICRCKKEERRQTKRELSGIPIEITPKKEIIREDIDKFFLEIESYISTQEDFILLTDCLWFYFKNKEAGFLMYNGKFVWNSKEGFLI